MSRKFHRREGLGSRLATVVMVTAVLALFAGCSDSDRAVLDPSLSCISDAPLTDQIKLVCGPIVGDDVTMTAVLGGGGAAPDIYEVAFKVRFDATLFEYVSVTEGDLFTAGGATLLIAAVDQQDPTLLTVAIALQGAVPGVPAPANNTEILSLVFRALGTSGTDRPLFEDTRVFASNQFPVPISFLNGIVLTSP